MTLGLAAPWIIIYKEIEAMFKDDEKVNVIYRNEECTVDIYVEDPYKAVALDRLLKHEHKFGNTVLKVNVIPANKYVQKSMASIAADDNVNVRDEYVTALRNNPAVESIVSLPEMILGGYIYVKCMPRPAQYFTDDLSCYNGIETKLYQDIAKDIFEARTGVSFCTERMEKYRDPMCM